MKQTHTVTCLPGGESSTVETGETLIRAMKQAGVKVPNLCGNNALCGTCAARVDGPPYGLGRRNRRERRMLRWIGSPRDVRLTCQSIVCGDVSVHTSEAPTESLDYDVSKYPWMT